MYNAFEYDIGGYNNKCVTWRWRIPPKWNDIIMLNLQELFASAMSIYITTQKRGQGYHILAFMDTSSALGWMYKA